MSERTGITYTLYGDDLVPDYLDEPGLKVYAKALKSGIADSYPDADVKVRVRWHVSGVGSGPLIHVGRDEDGELLDVDTSEVHDRVWEYAVGMLGLESAWRVS